MLALYKPALNWVLDHRWIALVLGLASVFVSGYYFYVLPKDFIPDEDIGFIIAFTQAEEGTSPQKMIGYQREVIKVIQSDPAVNTLVSIAGNPQYRNGLAFIRLKPPEERKPIMQVIQSLYPKLGSIPGVNTFLKNIPLIDLSVGPQSKGNYQYALQSLNTEALYQVAEEIMQKMQDIPIFQAISSDVEINSPQLLIEILRDQASTLGVSAQTIENTLQLAYAGGRVSRIETPIALYDVIVEVEPGFQRESKMLADLYVRSDTTQQLVPLSAVARWREGVGAASVNHRAQFPSATISFNLAPGVPLGNALEQLRKIADEVLPTSVTGAVTGAAQTFEESIQNANFLLLIAILAIYIVLGVLYESFIHPLTILSTLPPATFGALMTLAFFGLPLSLYAYLGIILLIGIVKKNGIIMVDYAIENEREKKESSRESIYQACLVRFRPIMMTTVTAIMGAVPIALGTGIGAEARRPLGLVIIGGLLFSQLITLFITPVMYIYLDRLSHLLTFKRNNGLYSPMGSDDG
jgi:HAE1 family hydrophobic/amphiphilic exporter-1